MVLSLSQAYIHAIDVLLACGGHAPRSNHAGARPRATKQKSSEDLSSRPMDLQLHSDRQPLRALSWSLLEWKQCVGPSFLITRADGTLLSQPQPSLLQ